MLDNINKQKQRVEILIRKQAQWNNMYVHGLSVNERDYLK